MQTLPVAALDGLALHRDAIVIDLLSTSPITAEQAKKMGEGGLTATNMTVPWVTNHYVEATHAISRWRRSVEAQSHRMSVATSVSDILRAKEKGGTAVIIGAQNGVPIGDEIQNLDALFDMGMRVIQLTYNERNYLGDGCTERFDGGLSNFGIEVVERMALLGVLVDLSHCSERTSQDAIRLSPKPVAITHANPYQLFANPRNKSDATLKLLADHGGVIGACAWSPLLTTDGVRRPTLADFLDAIDYLVNCAGIDHVGIGTDHGEGTYIKSQWDALYLRGGVHSPVTEKLGSWWQFEARFPEDLSGVTALPAITQGLINRGYSEGDIRKILGLNALRVLKEVFKESTNE